VELTSFAVPCLSTTVLQEAQSVENFSELGGLFALNPENPRVRCSIHRLATSSKTLAIKDLPSPKGSKQKPAKSGLLCFV
jgi:hypothetical protein